MLYCPNFFCNVLQVWMTGKDVYLQMTWSWPDKTWNNLCSYCLQWNTSQSKFRNHYFLFYLRFPYCPNFFWFGVVIFLQGNMRKKCGCLLMWTLNSLDCISHFLSFAYYSQSFLFAESLDFAWTVTSVDCERVKDIQTNFIQRRCGCLTNDSCTTVSPQQTARKASVKQRGGRERRETEDWGMGNA